MRISKFLAVAGLIGAFLASPALAATVTTHYNGLPSNSTAAHGFGFTQTGPNTYAGVQGGPDSVFSGGAKVYQTGSLTKCGGIVGDFDQNCVLQSLAVSMGGRSVGDAPYSDVVVNVTPGSAAGTVDVTISKTPR